MYKKSKAVITSLIQKVAATGPPTSFKKQRDFINECNGNNKYKLWIFFS